MACVKAAVADHFKVFFRYMPDEPFNKLHGRYGFFHVSIVFTAAVMEGDVSVIVSVNAGSGNYRPVNILQR